MTNRQSDDFKMPLKWPFIIIATLTALAVIVGFIINAYQRSEQFDEFKSKVCNAELADYSVSKIVELQRDGPKNDDGMKIIVSRIASSFPLGTNAKLYFEWSDGLWISRGWETGRFNRDEPLGRLGKWQDLIDNGQCVGKRSTEEFEIFFPINTSEGKAGILITRRIRG